MGIRKDELHVLNFLRAGLAPVRRTRHVTRFHDNWSVSGLSGRCYGKIRNGTRNGRYETLHVGMFPRKNSIVSYLHPLTFLFPNLSSDKPPPFFWGGGAINISSNMKRLDIYIRSLRLLDLKEYFIKHRLAFLSPYSVQRL